MIDYIVVFAHVPEGADRLRDGFLEELGREFLSGRGAFSSSWEITFRSAEDYLRFTVAWGSYGFDASAYYVRGQRRYTRRELSSAPFLRLAVERAPKGFGGPKHGTRFDMRSACGRCGTGATQASPLMVRAAELPKTGDVVQTLDNDLLIPHRVVDVLRGSQVAGIELRPIMCVDGGKVDPWVQLIATTALPPMAETADGIVVENQCPACRRDGYFHRNDRPEEIAYSAARWILPRHLTWSIPGSTSATRFWSSRSLKAISASRYCS
jgi:hypothetical protein